MGASWVGEKMLVTSIFSFSHDIFYSFRDGVTHLSKLILSPKLLWISENFPSDIKFKVLVSYSFYFLLTQQFLQAFLILSLNWHFSCNFCIFLDPVCVKYTKAVDIYYIYILYIHVYIFLCAKVVAIFWRRCHWRHVTLMSSTFNDKQYVPW